MSILASAGEVSNIETPTRTALPILRSGPPARLVAALTLTSATIGGLVVGISTLLLARDPAATLAGVLGFRSGTILGVLLGGLFGGWLVLGGKGRLARTVGFLVSLGILLIAWQLARPSFWIVDVIMDGVFGEGGPQYSGLAIFLIAFSLFRAIEGATTSLVARLLAQRVDAAPSPP